MPRTNNVAGWPTEDRVTDFDAEIVKAAEAFSRMYREKSINSLYPETRALLDAIAARDAALKPRLLTAEEAILEYGRATGPDPEMNLHATGLKAVLDAAMERAVKVIEAVPKHFLPVAGDAAGNATLHDGYVRVSAIRAALLPANPLTKRD